MVWSKLQLDDFFTTQTDKKIQEYILENIEKIPYMSIHKLSIASETSDSAVTRFCRKLGVNGYKDLKVELSRILPVIEKANKQYIRVNNKISIEDSVEEIFQKTISSTIDMLKQSEQIMDIHALRQAVDVIDQAKKLQLIAMGSSGAVAMDALYKFRRIQIPSFFSGDYHLQLLESSFLTTEDVVLGISVSGKTKEVIQIFENAKQKGATTVCIAQVGNLPSDYLTDIKLVIPYAESEMREGSVVARIAQLNIIDTLFLSLLCRRFHLVQGGINESREIANITKWKD